MMCLDNNNQSAFKDNKNMRDKFIKILPVLLLLILWGVPELVAHGPGRRTQVVSGYCAGEQGVVRSVTRSVEPDKAGVPFCLRMQNKEPIPVAANLSFAPGLTTDEGVDVCLITKSKQKKLAVTHNFFRIGETKCRQQSLIIQAGETKEFHGEWLFRPQDAGVMIGCILAEATPYDKHGDLHKKGVHIKRYNGMHMARLDGVGGKTTNQSQQVMAVDSAQETAICDPVPKLLRELKHKRAAEKPVTK